MSQTTLNGNLNVVGGGYYLNGVPFGGGGGGGVSTFNGRSGAVTLSSLDVTGALGYTPVNPTTLASYAPIASPTFTGTVTIPSGASIAGYAKSGANSDITSITGLTTPLAVTEGGTGVGTSTGTGNVVLSTSPTLVTPALGTPSFVNLSHGIGLTAGGINASGTASSTTFLRGDNTWATPPGGINFQASGTTIVASGTTLNVIGAGATLTNVSGVATLNVSGGSSGNNGINFQASGTTVVASGTVLNVTGSGGTLTSVSGVATLNLTGGSGGGGINFGQLVAPTATQTLLVYPVGSSGLTLSSGLPGSSAYAETAPTSATVITLLKNGSSIGTVNWAGGAHTGTVTFSSNVTFASGDVLTATAQAVPDATFANFGVVLVPVSGSSGALVLITSVTASGSSTEIDLLGVFTSAYDDYLIEIVGVNLASPASVGFQWGVSSGPTWTTAAYNWGLNGAAGGGGTYSAGTTSATSAIIFNAMSPLTPPLFGRAQLRMSSPLVASSYKAVSGDVVFYDGSVLTSANFIGDNSSSTSTAFDSFRVLSSVNITAGTVRVYGFVP